MHIPMATSKRVKSGQGIHRKALGMDWATVILAALLSIFFVAAMFARPTIDIAHGKVLYLDGIIASAIILGSMMWALIEVLTPPGNAISLIWRAGAGLIIGGAVGAYIGYSFNFSQYIIIPIFSGNTYAMFYFASVLLFGVGVIWDAA